ncbi:NAD(FAD)-dependent dehydrogenase [Halomonadaceae bacterium LMG 33818]|uniref:NAD(P)/FAD-dependent oxidoreductase n=1 Tax=Cernens ardua TaxID=3402176 RepID=UPI003EDB7A6A
MSSDTPQPQQDTSTHYTEAYDVVIVGGGSAGIAISASLLKRSPQLRVAIIEPSAKHCYQPAWTLVGGGLYDVGKTVRATTEVIPKGADWIQGAVSSVSPEEQKVTLEGSSRSIEYQQLVICPGLRLAWEKIDGLEETLGKNGVTSNYRLDLAPYTWQLVKNLSSGKAIFTQPGMPIKCAGAPQKALYLSCDYWLQQGNISGIDVEFTLAGNALFGVADFVPVLESYIERYDAKTSFGKNLVAIDGDSKKATFEVATEHGKKERVEESFDFIHVVPPQVAPSFIKESGLGNEAGWCDVDASTLQHTRYDNVFALGDCIGTSNAKTVAAARVQVVIVADNLLAKREGRALSAHYDGYGACPLTVERGKVVLAEFGYGGKLLPTLPLDPKVPRKFYWFLKTEALPFIYWNGMLKGHEWLTKAHVKKS